MALIHFFFWLLLRHKRRKRKFLSLLRCLFLTHSALPQLKCTTLGKSRPVSVPPPPPSATGIGEAPEWPTLYSTTDAAVASPRFQLQPQQQVKKEEERREPTFLPAVCVWKSWAEFAKWLFLLEGPFAHLDNELFCGPARFPKYFRFLKNT